MSTHCRTRHRGGTESEQDRIFFGEHGYLPRPHFVQWFATLRCRLRCPHCLAIEQGPARPELSLAEVETLLDQISEWGIEEFVVTGGEPLERADLPQIIRLLGERNISWTLNTAVQPRAAARTAMQDCPPSFVAVSVDGPAACHDRLRGRTGAFADALAAIRFYREIGVGEVVAGTTVTTRNFTHLAETFEEVVASGATRWGLHLLVPEGRAADNQSLFLSRRQLRGLLDFCATRRHYFPVEMADEIGYLGEEEPLVRSSPFFCGAGRTQCVILPDGEVVPCTTLDRSTSAGNVRHQPLATIWERGFGGLRYWEASGRCQLCAFAPACAGGCWLQRRHGTQCYRQVWAAPRLAKATAAAVCFGIGLGPEQMLEVGRTLLRPEAPAAPQRVIPELRMSAEPSPEEQARLQLSAVEQIVLSTFTAEPLRQVRADFNEEYWRRHLEQFGTDPVRAYLGTFGIGRSAKPWTHDLARRCEAVAAALETRQVSLSLAALLWRDLAEACLDGVPAAQRPAADQQRLRETMTNLASRSTEWRQQIFRQKLGPFIARQVPRSCFESKAGPPPWVRDLGTVTLERWGRLEQVTVEYVQAHRFGENLDLRLRCAAPANLQLRRDGQPVQPKDEFAFRIFDLLETAAPVELTVSDGVNEFAIKLGGGLMLSYPDLLRTVHEQHTEELRLLVRRMPPNLGIFALPALREALSSPSTPAARRYCYLRLRRYWLF